MFPEILLYVFLLTCAVASWIAFAATRWWLKVRDKYRALQRFTYSDDAMWMSEYNAAEAFRAAVPWYVKVINPRSYKP